MASQDGNTVLTKAAISPPLRVAIQAIPGTWASTMKTGSEMR